MALLEIHNLDVHYGAIQALRGVSVSVEQGKIVTMLGANGAGKSTTLRAVSGLIRPTRGEVRFDGKPIHNLPPHRIVEMGISHVPEGRGIFPGFTVEENLQAGAYVRKMSHGEFERERGRVTKLFPVLKERLAQPAGTLSGGEQQMLAIARALLSKPRLLLLDEPSLGLAPLIVQVIFRIIREINQTGTTILLVEQNIHMALNAAHEGYVLEAGSVVMKDEATKLAANDDVRKAYLGVG
ncbi:MAG: ABC transporter ATP-binding protein [Planctomycetes bacterium]|nr:ABC transporter ATP-binding protein [Planctomycetota bacterium]